VAWGAEVWPGAAACCWAWAGVMDSAGRVGSTGVAASSWARRPKRCWAACLVTPRAAPMSVQLRPFLAGEDDGCRFGWGDEVAEGAGGLDGPEGGLR